MTEVEIGIYTHRWSELQVRALESIARHTKQHQYSVLVTQVDGNCHQNMNRLWRRFSAPYVIMLDEDVEILQDGWLAGLLAALEADPELGVVGCTSMGERPESVPNPARIRVDYTWWIPAYVMAFKRERVPFLQFDEGIPGRCGMTDVDACLQIQSHGLKVGLNSEVVVYHPSREDDATRVREARPLVAEQQAWFSQQTAYMKNKWGRLFERAVSLPRPRRVIDAFLFYDEIELLELRLETLCRVVDQFVLVRGDRTFRGQSIDNPELDAAIAQLASRFNLSVRVVRLPVRAGSAWEREYAQRSALAGAVRELAQPEDGDVILTSDVDEVPDPERFAEAMAIAQQGRIACFRQLHCYFALNLLDEEPWYGTRALTWATLARTSAEAIRSVSSHQGQDLIEPGGWHFGWTGGNASIRRKVAAFSHAELDRPDLMSDTHLDQCIRKGVTLHNGHQLTPLPLSLLPRHVRENTAKYQHLLVEPPTTVQQG